MNAGRSLLHIIHVDLDAFFAAVEQRDRPELRGKPVIVGGDPHSRGVVSTCSYEARKFGVHSAMPLRTALAALPTGHFRAGGRGQVPARQPRGDGRAAATSLRPWSRSRSTRRSWTLPAREALFGPAPEIARRIKAEVVAATGLTVSVGVATNKLDREGGQRPAQTRRPGGGPAGRGGRLPRAPRDPAAVGDRAQDGRTAARTRDSNDRRACGAAAGDAKTSPRRPRRDAAR